MIIRILPVASRLYLRWLPVLLLIAGLCRIAGADPTAPGPADRHIVLAVTSLVSHQHVSQHPLDKEISERCLKNFLKALDPMKFYFYQSDIDEFARHKDELCSAACKGDIGFAYVIFRRYLLRIDERLRMVDELLTEPVGFTVDETLATDRETAQYARNAADARDLWRRRIKFDLLVLKDDKKEGKQARDKLSQRYHSIAKWMHQTSGDELLEMYLNSLTASLDPHSYYMSPDSQKDFEILMSLKLDGIGALLTNEDGCVAVKEISPGGPVDRDKRIKVGDKIVGVGEGENGEIVDVLDMKIKNVVSLIRGKRGTKVRLTVIPVGAMERKVYTLARDKIELKDREAKGQVFEAGRQADGSPYRVGVIDLPKFYRDMSGDRQGQFDFKSATSDVRNILDGFRRKHVDAVVLDLRRNGGGSLPEAVDLTGLFIDQGPVVQVKDANGRVESLDDTSAGMAWPGPLVVLTGKLSASASEILAGAIQDYGRGLIVGDRTTHGKGTVQVLLDLGQQLFRMPNAPPMGMVGITMQRFYRPSGDSTQRRGVLADIELPSLTTCLDTGEADQDYALEFDRVDPLRYHHCNDVSPAVCAHLRRLSQQRVRASEDFQKVVRNIARYKEQKARKFVALNEQKFLKERTELDVDKEEEKAVGDHNERDGVIQRNYYLNEVLAITADYLNVQHIASAQEKG
jgi:carboxyl-terminal processing protease